ncbi:MAG: hypothetical protein PWQ37_2351 [Candidatus Petromonas sp.]|nr:hypothetical protein [Candidatus Petromonas sp.]
MGKILGLKNKTFKLKTVIFQRIGKGLLWTLVVFLILRGIGTLFEGDETVSAKEMINELIKTKEYKERVEYEATSFAEGFVYEYMTTSRDSEDYLNRLKKYIPTYLYSLADKVNNETATKVLEANAYKIDWISENQLNVSVRAKVEYTSFEKQEDGREPKVVKLSNVYIKVPVTEKDGKYLVEDYPAFLPEPQKADIKFNFYSGEGVDGETSKEIEGVLENFFKTYYSGNSGEISYYMVDNVKIKGTEGRFKLNKVEEVRSYNLNKEGTEIFSIVRLTIIDSISSREFEQRFNVNLIRKDNRLYIKDFDVRTGNFK